MLTLPLLVPERPQTFHYNRSFTERPSQYTDDAWQSLFPRQGGYFRHPQIAPSRSAFAVFHQLHCLVRNSATATVSANAGAPPGRDTHGLLGGVRCCIGWSEEERKGFPVHGISASCTPLYRFDPTGAHVPA